MQITLHTEFRTKSFKYLLVSWVNADNPSQELGCVVVHAGFSSVKIGGLGPNARYLLLIYGSDDGGTKDVFIDMKEFRTGAVELNYACL